MTDVRLVYNRLPSRMDVFVQQLVHSSDGTDVTYIESVALKAPVVVDGVTVLEPRSPIVWFTFDGAWHDVGRFHNARGEFTGWYANVISPIVKHSPTEWECTDLFLDLWVGTDRTMRLLDEDELDAACAAGSISVEQAAAARAEAAAISTAFQAGSWPPRITREWTLERVRAYNG